jgi:hypothetical protein
MPKSFLAGILGFADFQLTVAVILQCLTLAAVPEITTYNTIYNYIT